MLRFSDNKNSLKLMLQLLSMKNTFKNKNLFYKKGIRVRHHLLQDKNATLRDKRIPGMPDPNKYA